MGKKVKETWAYWTMIIGEILPFIGGEMKPFLVAAIIALIISCVSTFGFLFGWLPTTWVDSTWEQFFYSIVSAAVFFGLLLVVALFVLVYMPARIYNIQRDELTKYNWDKVEFQEVSYSISGKSGYAFRILNNKTFDITKIQVYLTDVTINGKSNARPSRAWYFQSIDYDNDELAYLNDNGIKSGSKKDVAITEIVRKGKSLFCKLITSSEVEDVYIKLPYRGSKKDIESDVVIEIRLWGMIKLDDEKIVLPEKYIKIIVMPNGEIKTRKKEET